LSERLETLKCCFSNQLRKEAKFIMTITKIAAVVALAAATLTLGACAQKQAPAPATVGKSK
jgi:FlaG/FlaF family flagellin (archaellin)